MPINCIIIWLLPCHINPIKYPSPWDDGISKFSFANLCHFFDKKSCENIEKNIFYTVILNNFAKILRKKCDKKCDKKILKIQWFLFFLREKIWQKFDFSHFGEILHPKETLG